MTWTAKLAVAVIVWGAFIGIPAICYALERMIFEDNATGMGAFLVGLTIWFIALAIMWDATLADRWNKLSDRWDDRT